MKPNTHGWCVSYYGIWNIKDKPKVGVIYLMIDEHVKKIIEKEKERLEQEMTKTMEKFNKGLKETIKKQASEIKLFREFIANLSKLVSKIADFDGIKRSETEKKGKSRTKYSFRKKNEETEDDNNFKDGYL